MSLASAEVLQVDNVASPSIYTYIYFPVVFRHSDYSEVAWDASGTSCEWNRQFSFLVDDANVEMLEILVIDGQDPLGCRKPLARTNIPLRR